MTTAFLVLRMSLGDFRYREVPFDPILDEVQAGRAEAGLLIHEGQLTYEAEGLEKCLDLGEWWLLETGLPLPLGVNVARRDLGEERLATSPRVLRESIQAGPDNRREAIAYACLRARARRGARRPLRRDVRQRAARATTARRAGRRSRSCARAGREALGVYGTARVRVRLRRRIPAALAARVVLSAVRTPRRSRRLRRRARRTCGPTTSRRPRSRPRSSAPASIPTRSRTCTSAARTRPARTIGTSRAWPRSSPGCPSPSPA